MVKNQTVQNLPTEESSEFSPKPNIKWTSISLSEILERKTRLEASVYDIKGKQAREVIAKCRWGVVSLWSPEGLVDSAWYPTRFKRVYVENEGLPFYLPSQINEIYPKATKYISPKTAKNLDLVKVSCNSILMTRSGTIGNCTLVSKTLEDKIFSDDVIRITAKNANEIGYIYAFLKTEIGQTLVKTNNYGAVVSHIEPEHLTEIPIPNPQALIKFSIHKLIEDSFTLRDESNQLLDKAEKLLIRELKLPLIEKLSNKGSLKAFGVKLSELSERLEANFHNPVARAISEHLKSNAKEVAYLNDSRFIEKISLPTRFKRVYVDEGFGIPFFSGKQIYELSPSDLEYLSFANHGSKIKNELTLKEGMILVTCSGTVGKVAIVPKHWDGWAMTHDIIRLIPANKEITGYLYSWLWSDYGKALITRFSYGAVVGHIEGHHIAKVPVPILKDKDTQDEINRLALLANHKRYEAYILEQKAIQTVNEKVLYA